MTTTRAVDARKEMEADDICRDAAMYHDLFILRSVVSE